MIKYRALRYKKGVHFSVNPEYVECRGISTPKLLYCLFIPKIMINDSPLTQLYQNVDVWGTDDNCIRRMGYWWIMIDSRGQNVGSMLGCIRSQEFLKAHSVVYFLLILVAIWDGYWFSFLDLGRWGFIESLFSPLVWYFSRMYVALTALKKRGLNDTQ